MAQKKARNQEQIKKSPQVGPVRKNCSNEALKKKNTNHQQRRIITQDIKVGGSFMRQPLKREEEIYTNHKYGPDFEEMEGVPHILIGKYTNVKGSSSYLGTSTPLKAE